MREIKFRFWSGILRKFVVPNDDIFKGALADPVMNPMQYTGLKDKNGVEIYEGDVVECVEKEMFNKRKNHIKFISSVYWEDLSWTVREGENCETALAVYQDGIEKRPITTIKVIGNIYENAELLK